MERGQGKKARKTAWHWIAHQERRPRQTGTRGRGGTRTGTGTGRGTVAVQGGLGVSCCWLVGPMTATRRGWASGF
ncbi:hypothetical protein BS50DRAFT_561506, partial [Corynespora cassiicola Philippines]